MELNMIQEGFKLMALGMTTVFSFLILMVVILNFQAKILNRFFPQKPKTPTKISNGVKKADDGAVIAAITAAVTHYENDK